MGILRDFERALGGAVEGFFARAFRSGLQPVELAKALQRYAADYQQVGLDGVFVPNVYRFDVNADDFERFSGFHSALVRELADVVERTAKERSWHLQGPVRIELRAAGEIPVGTYELRGKVEAPDEEAPAPAGQPGGASPWAAPQAPPQASPHDAGPATPHDAPARPPARSVLSPTGRASLRIEGGDLHGRRFAIAETAVIGRLPECDVTLEDPSVSRRHARIQREDGTWIVEDLGSTNGLKVNGRDVRRAELAHGDLVCLGSVELKFSVESYPAGR